MKKKTTLIVLAVLLIAALAGGYYWLVVYGIEDTGGPVEAVPKPMATPTPLTTGPHDWPRWGGANHDNRSEVTGIRTDWSGGLKKLWEVRYLCQGDKASTWSGPVVVGNRLVVPGRDGKTDSDMVFCLDSETGELVWVQSYKAQTGTQHGPGPRATPCIDEDRVYTFGRSGDLACWKLLDGRKLWQSNVNDSGGKPSRWGYASAPLVQGNNVIVQAGGNATAVAYDKMTGKVAWTWQAHSEEAAFAAPRPMQVDDATQLLIFHATGLAGLTPEGKKLWNVDWKTTYGVNAATPMIDGKTVFITSDYGKGCAAVNVASDSATRTWANKAIQSHHSDPAIIDGYVYGYSGKSDQNRGDLVCLKLADGSQQWETREVGHGTMVQVDGHLICLDNAGDLFLIKPDPSGFKKVTEFPKAMPNVGDHAWTRPVIANGKLYLRYRQTLICYDLINE